jgi:hypothetical protein
MKKIGCLVGIVFMSIILNTKELQDVISELQKSVIPIKFTLKYTGGGGGEVESEYVQKAIVISEDLVVITDAGPLSPPQYRLVWSTSETWSTTSFGRGIVKPKFARVYIGKDLEVPAKFLGVNKEYDIAYFKIVPKAGQKLDLKPLQLIDENKIQLKAGDEVFELSLDTRARKFGFPFKVDKTTVKYQYQGGKNEVEVGYNFEIVVDKDYNILGFNFESPTTRRAKKGTIELSESGWGESLDSSGFGLLFTKSKLEELKNKIPKEEKKGWLGFLSNSLKKVSPELKEELGLTDKQAGLRISDVPKDKPADLAGLKVDDIIIEIGGKKTVFETPQEAAEFSEWVDKIEIGKSYKVKFLRKEGNTFVEKETTITAIEKPPFFDDIDEISFKFFGIRVKPITYDYRYNNRLPEELNGLVVVFAERGDPFNVAGIWPGDIILAIGTSQDNLKEIKSVEDLKNVLRKLNESKPEEVIVKIFTGWFILSQYEGATKEIKLKTVRVGAKNYAKLEKDLEE